MHSLLSKSYLVPAIFLNPVLFLMSLNTILSRVLPPVLVDAKVQPPPYSTFGPSAEHPHIDIHASDSLCWGYTFVIVFAQLVAFGRVSVRREEHKRVSLNKKKHEPLENLAKEKTNRTFSNVHKGPRPVLVSPVDASSEHDDYSSCAECAESDLESRRTEDSDRSAETTDSEMAR